MAADRTWWNRARVIGRTGGTVCAYAELAAFHDEAWGEEAIVRGEELPLVVTGDLVVDFADCKDFCDRAVAGPFAELPIDLVLVPSMGAASTLARHVVNAESLRLRNGTLVFVVQQLPPDIGADAEGRPLGHGLR